MMAPPPHPRLMGTPNPGMMGPPHTRMMEPPNPRMMGPPHTRMMGPPHTRMMEPKPPLTGANMMPLRAPHPQKMTMPFFMMPQPPNMQGMGPKPPVDMAEPSSKPMRGEEEESLIPESEFMARQHLPVVTFKVAVPNVADRPEWKLNGQTITLTLPLYDTVAVIKSKLNEELALPPGKQRLKIENIFLKDSNTLGFYNVTPGMVVHLHLKERGRRNYKKYLKRKFSLVEK
jgi:splicing factor 3A subunit 1